MESKIFNLSLPLKITVALITSFWCLIAVFPLLWVLVMSIKLPVDSFASNPLEVIFGPATKLQVGGLSIINLLVIGVMIYVFYKIYQLRFSFFSIVTHTIKFPVISFFINLLAFVLIVYVGLIIIQPLLSESLNAFFSTVPVLHLIAKPVIGFTSQHYEAVWVENEFYKQFFNTIIVTSGVLTISLTVGTLAGYGLARTNSMMAFWLLIAALVFRALPHSVLVTGYLEPFINYGLYGKRTAVIIILVAINQPFTIWMMRSFFMNIPQDLDEAAQIDGANPFQKFRYITLPLLRRTILFVFVADTAANFVLMVPMIILTKGGPMQSTNVLVFEAYRSGFYYQDWGRSLSIITILTVITLIVIGLQLLFLGESRSEKKI